MYHLDAQFDSRTADIYTIVSCKDPGAVGLKPTLVHLSRTQAQVIEI